MALVDFSHIKSLFSADKASQTDHEVFREFMVMVLSRATDADAYTHPAEVETVQKAIQHFLGEEVSTNDIHIAARSQIFESAPLDKYIAKVGPQLPRSDRCTVIQALIEVLHADERVAASEAEYFNMVATALQLTFAEVAGLHTA